VDHRSRAFVFDDFEDHHARIAEPDFDIDETCVMVLRNRGADVARDSH
jgi:L-arabonate dehydrase